MPASDDTLRNCRRAVDYVFKKNPEIVGDIPSAHIAFVLLALDGVVALTDPGPDPAARAEKVQTARRLALDKVLREQRERSRYSCPDGGTCHHQCEGYPGGHCWRVHNAGPLSGVFPDDRWPRPLPMAVVRDIPNGNSVANAVE